MREIRLSGSEGGGTGNSTGSPYPYPPWPCSSVGAGHARDSCAREGKRRIVFACPLVGAWSRSKNGRQSVQDCIPTLERGNDQKLLSLQLVRDELAEWQANRRH